MPKKKKSQASEDRSTARTMGFPRRDARTPMGRDTESFHQEKMTKGIAHARKMQRIRDRAKKGGDKMQGPPKPRSMPKGMKGKK